jgi:NAD-dependent dihydropyrimidine dehydrogenase PreA subunit
VTYVITSSCVDVKDMSCIEECPVDCIYEGDRKLYIQPKECIDCGACEPVCPVDAIYADRALPSALAVDREDNAAFFYELLPGRQAPIGAVGGAAAFGPVDADTPRTAALPPNDADEAASA